MKCPLLFIALIFIIPAYSQQLPLPNKYQLAWHENEFYLFMHFGPNTFTDMEWGEGTEPASVFDPVKLDCRQWCRVAKEAGAKAIIITAKHHDGFCLWPSKYSSHTVRESRWKGGKGDVLRELSEACREAGIKFGVYISPWDRNHPDYGSEKYNDVFVNMMKEVLTQYGPVWELWWDGANGEGPNGKRQVYDWVRFEKTVREISPATVIFSDIGPDIRWVGNEKGIAGDPNWNYLDTVGFRRGLGSPEMDTLNHGNYNGRHWIPGECDVSIRPGWFWHPGEDDKVKTPEQLFALYLKSVGRGANLLLNVPPDSTGLIGQKDIVSLKGFKKLRDESFKRDITRSAKTRIDWDPERRNVFVRFGMETTINSIVLKENIKSGQQIRKFRIELYNKNNQVGVIKGTSVGRKRILTFPARKLTGFQVILEEANAKNNILSIASFLINEQLIEK